MIYLKRKKLIYIFYRMISKSLKNRVFPTIEEFSVPKYTQPLGIGSFGTVRLGTHKYTNKIYAIKIICVDNNFKQNQLCLLQRQITIHYTLNHPHIIRLWDVIEEKDKIYLIMEYAEKGNLFTYQSQNHSFSEVETFKIFIQMIDAIDYLHRNNIVHRDIKPENILLDYQMNVKLCDFGWAAPDITRKRSTFCGTYEYMAPEMVNQLEYDYRIDIWALGVLLYELIHCQAPFPAQTFDQMRVKIKSGCYEINVNISNDLKNLIMSILQFQAKDRPSISQIKNNSWMQKMKRMIQVQKVQQRIEKKKGKNIYGSLDFNSIKNKEANKFGSILCQENFNKKQPKITPMALKKKVKKCKTLQEQFLQKQAYPYNNILTTFQTQKQNFDATLPAKNQSPKTKYKMLTKITETEPQKQQSSKLNFARVNNLYIGGQTAEIKNQKTDKTQKNVMLNKKLQTVDAKKKRKKVV